MLDHQDTLDGVFHALSDRSRRQMLDRLVRGSATVSELGAPLEMSLSAVVQHVRVLEASGLVATEKVGRVRTCRLDPLVLRTAEQWFGERRVLWERRLDRLGAVLAEEIDAAGPTLSTDTEQP